MLPAYVKIHDQIKKDIDEGVWEIGDCQANVILLKLSRSAE